MPVRVEGVDKVDDGSFSVGPRRPDSLAPNLAQNNGKRTVETGAASARTTRHSKRGVRLVGDMITGTRRTSPRISSAMSKPKEKKGRGNMLAGETHIEYASCWIFGRLCAQIVGGSLVSPAGIRNHVLCFSSLEV